MRHALCLGALLTSLACPASAQDAQQPVEASEADVRKLLAITGAGQLGQQVIATMGATMRQAHPGVPAATWAELLAELRAEELVELIVPIYRKHLTRDDVRGLIAFFESPLGRKLVAVQPQILAESMAAGHQWGEECARRVFERLKTRGLVGQGGASVRAPVQ